MELKDLNINTRNNYSYYRIIINKKYYQINVKATQEELDQFLKTVNEQLSKSGRSVVKFWQDKFSSPIVYKYAKGAWGSINQRTINGKYTDNPSVANNPQQVSYINKGIRLEFTQEEFYSFVEANSDIILKIYADGGKPSLDRIDTAKDYSLDNIQIIPLSDNLGKRRKSKKPKQFLSKIGARIYNRKAYIKHQPSGNYEELNIDKYFDKMDNKEIITAASIGLINNPFEPVRVIEETRHNQVIDYLYNILKTVEEIANTAKKEGN